MVFKLTRKIKIRNEIYIENTKPKVFKIKGDIKNIKSPSKEDKEERERFLNTLKKLCNMFLDFDINSRRIAIQEKYCDNDQLASCMSFVQFLIRDNTVFCYCVMRSEIDYIHEWDCDTLRIMTNYIQKRYNIKKSKITMTVNSYHKKLD